MWWPPARQLGFVPWGPLLGSQEQPESPPACEHTTSLCLDSLGSSGLTASTDFKVGGVEANARWAVLHSLMMHY